MEQNITLAASFGFERDVAFEHAETKSTVALHLGNGTMYSFGKKVNAEWRHGIPLADAKLFSEEGRISVIVWGTIDMVEA